MPGHGSVEPGHRGIDQTRRWLNTVEAQIGAGFERGLNITELIAELLPLWTNDVAKRAMSSSAGTHPRHLSPSPI